ncbi:MAG: LapA family protein [Sulfuricellaceae bacterium]|nr:LapA family protein [Sulfuricellaceae bacterium]
MRYFSFILGFILFWFAIGFAVKNSELVTLYYYLGYQWQAPLVVVILTVFGIGVGTGLVATLGLIIAQKRNLNRLRKELMNNQAKSAEMQLTQNTPL